MANYLIRRHGSNAANQSMTRVANVAIVEAKNRDEAVAKAIAGDVLAGAEHSFDWSTNKIDYSVSCYANQSLEAIPESKARISDWNEVLNTDAMSRV